MLNADVIALVDESLDGLTAVTVSGTTTLSSVNYATDQSRRRILKCSGAGGTVIIPGVTKTYLVHNTCTAAVTVKTAGGTGIVVNAGACIPLYCDGTDCFQATTVWPVQDGTVSAPGLYFASESNSGFYRVASHSIGFSIGGAKVLGITAAGLAITGTLTATGSAAVASASVSGALTVGGTATVGAVVASGAIAAAAVAASGSITAATMAASGAATAGSFAATGAITGDSLSLVSGATIGGAATAGSLAVSGAATAASLQTTGGLSTVASVNTPLVASVTNTSAGANATAYFEAWNGTSFALFGQRGTGQTAYGALLPNLSYVYTGSSSLVLMADGVGSDLVFAAGGSTEIARASRSGSTTTWQFGLSSFAFGLVPAALSIGFTGFSTQYGIVMRPQIDTTTAISFSNAAGSGIGSIQQTNTTVTYTTVSDYRTKRDITDLVGSGDFIDALRPVQFKWAVDDQPASGFIAHEAQAVSPSSVSGVKDAVEADGQPIYQAMQAGSPEIIANLVAELQSVRARLVAAGIP